MQRPRLLFYAVNGLGLGHVTRLLALARAVRRQCPGAEILFLTTSEASHIIYQEGFAALKVPSRAAASTGGLRRGTWLRLVQTIVWNTATAFDPHCMIVDTFAAGTLQELLPLLRWPLRKVFVFRAQRLERATDPFLQNTLRLYDLILVPHEQGSEEVPTPAEVRTVWTGPMLLRAPSDLLPRATARAALELPEDATVGLLTLGGGGEPEAVAARAHLQHMGQQMPEVLWVEAEGPLARVAEIAPAKFPARVLRGLHPLMMYLHAFDFAVSAVGYNTTHELQAAAVPAVLWPFARDVDDQAARAQRLAQQGRALCLGEGAAEAGRGQELVAAVRRLMQAPTREQMRVAMRRHAFPDGGSVGAAAVLELLM